LILRGEEKRAESHEKAGEGKRKRKCIPAIKRQVFLARKVFNQSTKLANKVMGFRTSQKIEG